jgi:hypothetical protein
VEVVPVGRFFGAPDGHGAERPLLRALADDAIDYGPVDLVLHLPVYAMGEFTAATHALRPEAREAWEALVRGRTPALVIDCAHEGPGYQDAFAHRIHRLVAETGLRSRAIWFAQTNRRYARRLRESPNAPRVAKAIGHIDSHLYAEALAVRALRQGLAQASRAMLDAQSAGDRVLLCLNGAPRFHRAALAYRIAQHRHRGRAVVTFHMSAGPKMDLARAAPRAQELLAATGTAADDLADALSAHPFDVDPSRDDVFGRRDLSLAPQLHRATRISIVTETDFTAGGIVRYTEKSLKPLLMGHPLVVLGNPHTLPLLEELGFDVFRDLIPAGYDSIADPHERFREVLGIVDGLLTDPPALPWPAGIRERLLANIALFEGPLLDTLRRRERQSIEAAARRMG